MNDRLCWFLICVVFSIVGFFVGVFPIVMFLVG